MCTGAVFLAEGSLGSRGRLQMGFTLCQPLSSAQVALSCCSEGQTDSSLLSQVSSSDLHLVGPKPLDTRSR